VAHWAAGNLGHITELATPSLHLLSLLFFKMPVLGCGTAFCLCFQCLSLEEDSLFLKEAMNI
jgi:hypothetical protein